MCRSLAPANEPQGWPGLFRPLKHYVPTNSRLLRVRDFLVAPGFPCGSMCEPPTSSAANLPWCAECRRHLDWLWPHPSTEENNDERPTN
jgi:hypothetical protein